MRSRPQNGPAGGPFGFSSGCIRAGSRPQGRSTGGRACFQTGAQNRAHAKGIARKTAMPVFYFCGKDAAGVI